MEQDASDTGATTADEEAHAVNQGSPLLRDFEPLSAVLVDMEIETIDRIAQEMDALWEDECSKYEETMSVSINGRFITVPRRNYADPSGKVLDHGLYPYHTACYPLLDAYDHIYSGGGIQPIEASAILPCTAVPLEVREDAEGRGEFELPGYMPASLHSIVRTLVQQTPVNWPVLEEYPHAERLFQMCQLHNNRYFADIFPDNYESETFWNDVALEDVETPSTGDDEDEDESLPPESQQEARTGPAHLPSNRQERVTILLKLLRHSMSELQRDHTLSTAVLVRLMRHHDFDNVDVLRKVLVIIRSEFVACDIPCDLHEEEVEDHFCPTWLLFLRRIPFVLAFGVTCMTRDHATALAGFVRSTYLREFGHLLGDAEAGNVEQRRKLLLKRNLMNLRAEDDDQAFATIGKNSIPVEFMLDIITALGMRAAIDRYRLIASQSSSDVPDVTIEKTMDSHLNCVRALVEIGEASVQIFPCNARFYKMSSGIVRGVCRSTGGDFLNELLMEHPRPLLETGYLGLAHRGIFDSRLVSPLRLSDCVSEATARFQRLPKHCSPNGSKRDQLMHAVDKVINGKPHNDIRDVVRGLFVRNLVDIRFSGLGYSDFLVWGRFEVTPLEPLLFWKDVVYPVEEESSDDDEEEEGDDESVNWDYDEEEHLLSTQELEARVDFSTLALVRAWDAPWSPQSHMSFQPLFRAAVKTLGLCTHRLGMPNELVHRISEFMHRDWWHDERKTCFDYECQVEQVGKSWKRKVTSRLKGVSPPSGPTACVSCPGCRLTNYCSNEHLEVDFKGGHKNHCGLVPFCAPTKEETGLFASLFPDDDVTGVTQGSGDPGIDIMEEDGGGDADTMEEDVVVGDATDGDDDWESIDSDEEDMGDADAQATNTQLIHQFFKKAVYNKRY